MMKSKIMIVEDELILAKDLEQLLINEGYEPVGICRDYSSAVKAYPQLRPDMIICDINLAGKEDGITLIDELMKLRKIPVIYLTAFSDQDTVDRATHTYPAAFLLKPFNERNLRITIALAINNSQVNGIPVNEAVFGKFTKRELEVVRLLADGNNSEQISELLFISKHTVDTHRKNLLAKFGMHSTAELVRFCATNGLLN